MRTFTETLNRRIREILRRKDMTQTRVAAEAGIEAGYLSELLNGKKRWNAEYIENVRHVLGVEPWELFINPDEIYPSAHRAVITAYTQLDSDAKRIVDQFLFGGKNAAAANAPLTAADKAQQDNP